jgi:ComF family protein
MQKWLGAALALVYPEGCQICRQHRTQASEGYVCEQCRAQVQFIRHPFCERCGLPYPGEFSSPFECGNCREMAFDFRYARAAVVAKTVVLEAIHRFKYTRALWFEEFLTSLLIQAAAPQLKQAEWDFIVPVPLHPLKKREREFNQAEILARRLSFATRIPVEVKILKRVVSTTTQTLLSRQKRAINMRGAFATSGQATLEKKRIILLDDILTTGATTNACAQALRRAGAADVCVWTVARGT